MPNHATTLARKLLRDFTDLPTYEQAWVFLTNDGEGDERMDALSKAVLEDREDTVEELLGMAHLTDILDALIDAVEAGAGNSKARADAKTRADLAIEDTVGRMLEHAREVGYAMGVAVGQGWRR